MNKHKTKVSDTLRQLRVKTPLTPLACAVFIGAAVPTASADWALASNLWTLDTQLNTPSATARESDSAALNVLTAESARIEEGAGWNFVNTLPTAITFDTNNVLILNGDLEVAFDLDDSAFSASGVLFEGGNGNVFGGGSIIVSRSLEVTSGPVVLTGLATYGPLNLSNFSGDILVTNDSRLGPTEASSSETESGNFGLLPLLDGDIDLSKSAVAVGLGAVDIEEGLALQEVTGAITGTIEAVAFSRDIESFTGIPDSFETGEANAVTGGIAIGAIGSFQDGVAGTASIRAAATSGDSEATNVDNDDASALSVALAAGVIGEAGTIGDVDGRASLVAEATSGKATAMGESATAISAAASAAFLGGFGTIQSADFVSTATSGNVDLSAFEPGTAASLALGVGLAGLGGAIDDATIGAQASSGAATGSFASFEIDVSSLAISSGLIGSFGDLTGSTVSATSTADIALINTVADAEARSVAISTGLIGAYGNIEDSMLSSSAFANDATAGAEFGFAEATSVAAAVGLANFEILQEFGETLIGEVDLPLAFPGDLGFNGEFAIQDDLIETNGTELPTINANISVTAVAQQAEATIQGGGDFQFEEIEGDIFLPQPSFGGFASAEADAFAAGIQGAGDRNFAGNYSVSAASGRASAEGSSAQATATAEANGVVGNEGDFFGSFGADMQLLATAGNASSNANAQGGFILNDIEGDLSANRFAASAEADANTIGYSDFLSVFGPATGIIIQLAEAGTANALSLATESPFFLDEMSIEEDIFLEGGSYASASASSIFIEAVNFIGDIDAEVLLEAFGGVATADDLASGLAVAEAFGEALLLDGDLEGNLSGKYALAATGGTAVANAVAFDLVLADGIEGDGFGAFGGFANADATAIGINGQVFGELGAEIALLAEGGQAAARGFSFDPKTASARAIAIGVNGGVFENYASFIEAEAFGGTAFLVSVDEFDQIPQDFMEFGDRASASARAIGVGAGEVGVLGDVSGIILAGAQGGETAFLPEFGGLIGPMDTLADPISLEGDFFEGGSSFGIVDGPFSANATAIGINGDVQSTEVSGIIQAIAAGGSVVEGNSGDIRLAGEIEGFEFFSQINAASAFAAGIAGQSVEIENFTGDILAIAVPGTFGFADGGFDLGNDAIEGDFNEAVFFPSLPEATFEAIEAAFAVGIMAYTPGAPFAGDFIEALPAEGASGLDITIGGAIRALIDAPSGFELLEDISYAAAIYGGQADDRVELTEGAFLVGDINLGGGINNLTVTGDTSLEGNILSTGKPFIDFMLDINSGMGRINFSIDSGFFTPVGTVVVSDLNGPLSIGAEGGLSPILSQNPMDGESSRLQVGFGMNGTSADVVFTEGATLLPTFAQGVDLGAVIGNQYVIVDAEGMIADGGVVVDRRLTPFEFTIEVVDTAIELAPEGIDFEIGGQQFILTVDSTVDINTDVTSGSAPTNQAINLASQAIMLDISQHGSYLRSLLRRTTLSTSGAGPVGAAGPQATRLQNGEWLSYLSAFGNIGKQDTSGGINGFDYDSFGFVIGQERLFGDRLIVGLAGSYARTDVDGLNNSGGGDSDLYGVAAYLNWFTERLYAEGGLTFGYAENDVSRVDALGDRYVGDYDSKLFGGWFEIGKTLPQENYELEPYGRLTYVYGRHDGFTDSGPGGAPLTMDDTTTNNFKSELGLRASRTWMQEDESSYLVQVKAAWEHEWADRRVSVNASDIGNNALTLRSPEADRDALALGILGQWRNGRGVAVGFEYEPTVSGNWYNHSFTGTIQYNW